MTLEAKKKTQRKYQLSEKGKVTYAKYNHSKKGKLSQERFRQNHREKRNQYSKEHHQTKQGKILSKKYYNKRKRNLGFTILIGNQFNCDVDYHHINNEYVVAVPRYIHQGTLGKNHRVECNLLVEKLYGIDIEKEVEKYENKI